MPRSARQRQLISCALFAAVALSATVAEAQTGAATSGASRATAAETASGAAPRLAVDAARPRAFSAFGASVAALRDSLVSRARESVGIRYLLGGTDPSRGLDCSALIRHVLSAFDISLPRTAQEQARMGREIPKDRAQMKPGDLLTFGTGSRITHIGMYVGEGRFIHASTSQAAGDREQPRPDALVARAPVARSPARGGHHDDRLALRQRLRHARLGACLGVRFPVVGTRSRHVARQLARPAPLSTPAAPVAELSAEFALASARLLPAVAAGHPCGRVHGHTFGVRLVVRGPVDPTTGWVVDFEAIAAAWRPVHEALDHRMLNDVPGLENPTSERIALWIWEALRTPLPMLIAVEISETGGFRVTYRGE